MYITHLTGRVSWKSALQAKAYRATSLESEGFIHLSRFDQIVNVANTFYRGQQGLVLLVVDTAHLQAELRWEPPAGGIPHGAGAADKFPHLYGSLNLDAVVAVCDIPPNPDGTFELPAACLRFIEGGANADS